MKNNSLLAIMDQISETPPLLFEGFTQFDQLNPIQRGAEPWNEIAKLYDSKITAHKIAGIILNGVITNQKPKFLFSYRICNNMIEAANIGSLTAINGTTYKKVLAQLTDQNVDFMRKVENQPMYNSSGYKAWIFELSYQPALKYLQK